MSALLHPLRHPARRAREINGARPAGAPVCGHCCGSTSHDPVNTAGSRERGPDIDAVLRGVWRMVSPGALRVFALPMLWHRPRPVRAMIPAGQPQHLLTPSEHGAPGEQQADDALVCPAFGADFVERCTQGGLDAEVMRDAQNPALCTCFGRRPSA